MIAVVQRVKRASVAVEGRVVGSIRTGALVLLGVGRRDTEEDARWLVRKVAELRYFPDEEGRMNRSLEEIGGALLAVSQFTLHADCRKGRRPSFTRAAEPAQGRRLYAAFLRLARERELPVEEGVFGALMEVELVNWGPVTFLLRSPSERQPEAGGDR